MLYKKKLPAYHKRAYLLINYDIDFSMKSLGGTIGTKLESIYIVNEKYSFSDKIFVGFRIKTLVKWFRHVIHAYFYDRIYLENTNLDKLYIQCIIYLAS